MVMLRIITKVGNARYERRVMCLELAMSASNRESHVDAAQNIVGVGLAVEEGLGFEVTLRKTRLHLKYH